MEDLVARLERRHLGRGDRRRRPGEERAVHLRVEFGLEALAPALDGEEIMRRHPLAVHDAADHAPVDLADPVAVDQLPEFVIGLGGGQRAVPGGHLDQRVERRRPSPAGS